MDSDSKDPLLTDVNKKFISCMEQFQKSTKASICTVQCVVFCVIMCVQCVMFCVIMCVRCGVFCVTVCVQCALFTTPSSCVYVLL